MLTANEILEWDDEGVAAPPKPVLVVENLVKHFVTKTWLLRRTTSIVRAADGVSFSVNDGETFGIVGPPGSGKSTIARLLMRLAQPDRGVIRWRGMDVGSRALPVKRYRRDVQMVFQSTPDALDPRLRIGRSIAFGSAVRGMSRMAADASAREVMARVGLEPKLFADRYPHELREGQRLRVNLARALAASPKLLVLDEAAGGFDKAADLPFLELLRELRLERNLTYIFLSRHMSLAQLVCDRIATLQSGQILTIEARETTRRVCGPARYASWQLASKCCKQKNMTTATIDRPKPLSAPYFNPVELRQTLTALHTRPPAGVEPRAAVVDRLKKLVTVARASAQAELLANGRGRQCARGLSHFQDELIRLVFDYVVEHVYQAENPSDAERMAVVATGGYGRGLLAPGSDIDLLFLLPYKQTPWGESVAEAVLYLLWDLGFKVGHATRNVDQSLKYAQADMTIRTSMLDARLIKGDTHIFEEMTRRFRSEIVSGTARAFTDAKMVEREQRHQRSGESRYLVEPNVKDGKGGLRDLHTLHWLATYIYGNGLGEATLAAGIFTPEEIAVFRKCEGFLWTVRCNLHFLTGRPEERLSFDVQTQMAQRLGYKDHGGLKAVERFMKHYFLIAKDVGGLTSILCTSLEMQQLKTAPRLGAWLDQLGWRARRQVRTLTDFRIDNDRLNIADPEVFTRDPVNLIRFFAQAEKTGAFLHPFAIRRLRNAERLVDERLRNNPEANRVFVELLTSKANPETALRQMNEAGILGRFIPEFGRVVSMMQFNMYHHYTVDEHLLRTVGQLRAIEEGQLADTLPLSSEVIKSIQNRRALYVAAFLHDVGKGRTEDHSVAGARIAAELCPRFGLTAAETDTVTWLIREHLTMSNIAQSRDLGDP